MVVCITVANEQNFIGFCCNSCFGYNFNMAHCLESPAFPKNLKSIGNMDIHPQLLNWIWPVMGRVAPAVHKLLLKLEHKVHVKG